MKWASKLLEIKLEAAFFIILLIFSAFLMWKTFGITPKGNLNIAGKVYSDFSATIPLIRSFSYGNNFPPQYPLFAGPPIRYHFIFFTAVGALEKIGLSLPLSLNLLSSLAFFLLLAAIFFLGKALFNTKAAVISVILFIFNSSFSFIEFFKTHPLSLNTPTDIVSLVNFTTFGPYDGSTISAFWSLNIYTNQRHLAFAYASFIFLVFMIYKSSLKPANFTFKKAVFVGIYVGLFPFVHLAVFGMMGIALILFFLLYPKLRKKIFASGIIALVLASPQLSILKTTPSSVSFFSPGYLVENLTTASFVKYWLLNLGLTVFLSPLGFVFAQRLKRKIFIPFLALFLMGNLFQFSREVAANHKFFNLFVIGANFYTAYLLTILWKKRSVGKMVTTIALILLTLSGIIDLFPIINDRNFVVEDIPNNKTANFIYENTPKDSVFLNASFLYDPASLAGRRIYLGWPYFAWSAGYDTGKRHEKMKRLLDPEGKTNLCRELQAEGLDYIEIKNPTDLEGVSPNYSFFEGNFAKIFMDSQSRITIYSVSESCKL